MPDVSRSGCRSTSLEPNRGYTPRGIMSDDIARRKQTWQAFSAGEYYQKFCVPRKFEPWPPVVLDRVGLARGERVLDCACGTGVVTRHAARRAGPDGKVVGLDFNAGMLAVARSIPADGAP